MDDLGSMSFGKGLEAKVRTSFAGGFQIPKSQPVPEPQQARPKAPLPSAWAQALQPSAPSGDVIGRLEDQLRALQAESHQIRQQRNTPQFAVESLLHADYHDTGYHAPPSSDETMTLDQVESMKRQNAYRLIELEAEYEKRKGERAQKGTTWGKAKYEASASVQKYMLEIEAKVKAGPSLTPEQTDYKSKFEKYLIQKASKQTGKAATSDLPQSERLLKFIFKTIDKDKDGQIDKVELLQELQSNEELPLLLGFSALVTDSDYMESLERQFQAISPNDQITFEQFIGYFQAKKEGKRAEIEVPTANFAPAPALPRALGPPCLLTPSQLSLLEHAFKSLDKDQDLAVPRSALCDYLRGNKQVHKLLHIDAVQLSAKEAANLETILDLVECDGESLDELITWQQFLLYFQSKPVIETNKQETDPISPTSNPLLDAVDLNEAYMQLIMDVFDSIPRVSEGQIALRSFLIALRSDAQVQSILSKTAREPSGLSTLPTETVAQVLNRLEKQANKNLSWAEVVGFFSKRGQPANYESGYDSDPEGSRRGLSPVARQRTAGVQMGEVTDRVRLSTSFSDEKVQPKPWILPKKKQFFAPTVPRPFKFESRESARPKTIKQRQMEELKAQKKREEEEILAFQYRAQPVPAEVLVPKLESMMGAQEAKREKVRLESAKMLESKVKPFSFYYRDQGKDKSKAQPQDFSHPFKASPVPIHATLPIFEQMMQNKEAARKAKLKKEAAELLAQSKMPQRMEQHEKQRAESAQAKGAEESFQRQFSAKEPPDFHAIHKAFNEAMVKKKQSVAITKVEPFNLNENKKRLPKEPEVDLEREAMAKWGSRAPSATASVNLPEPRLTVNETKRREALKKKDEEAKAATAAQEEAERLRQQKYQEAVQRVKQSGTIRGSSKALEEEKQQKLQKLRRDQRERAKDFEENKQAMLQKVKTKPLLVEKATSYASKYTAFAKAVIEKSQQGSQVAEEDPREGEEDPAQPYVAEEEDEYEEELV